MKNMIKRIIIGIIIGLVLMACRKYLFVNANASTINGLECDTPRFATIGSGYNSVNVRIWTQNIFPNNSVLSYSYAVNRYVYVTACSDMPSIWYSYNNVWNPTTGSYSTGDNIKYTANLTNKTCTFSNGNKGHVVYLKFRLVNQLLNVPQGSGTTTALLNDYVTLTIGSRSSFSFSIQSILDSYDDVDIYSNDFDPSVLENQLQAVYDVTVAASNSNYNALNNVNSSINNMNNSLKDESSPDVEDDLFDGISTDDESNSPVSDLILMPLTLMNAYVDGFSSTCNSFNLGSLYNHNITLPCIDIEDYLGSNLWALIDIMFSLFLVYNIGLMCVSMYESITSLEDGFRGLYTPRHADTGYTPRHGGGE